MKDKDLNWLYDNILLVRHQACLGINKYHENNIIVIIKNNSVVIYTDATASTSSYYVKLINELLKK